MYIKKILKQIALAMAFVFLFNATTVFASEMETSPNPHMRDMKSDIDWENNRSVSSFWYDDVFVELVSEIQENGDWYFSEYRNGRLFERGLVYEGQIGTMHISRYIYEDDTSTEPIDIVERVEVADVTGQVEVIPGPDYEYANSEAWKDQEIDPSGYLGRILYTQWPNNNDHSIYNILGLDVTDQTLFVNTTTYKITGLTATLAALGGFIVSALGLPGLVTVPVAQWVIFITGATIAIGSYFISTAYLAADKYQVIFQGTNIDNVNQRSTITRNKYVVIDTSRPQYTGQTYWDGYADNMPTLWRNSQFGISMFTSMWTHIFWEIRSWS